MQLLNLVWKALCAQLGMVMERVPMVFGPDGGRDGCRNLAGAGRVFIRGESKRKATIMR